MYSHRLTPSVFAILAPTATTAAAAAEPNVILYVGGIKLGVEIDACCLNIMIKGLCGRGDLEGAFKKMTHKPVTAFERRKMTVSKTKETINSEPSKQEEEMTHVPPTVVKKKLRLTSKGKEITPPEHFTEQDEEMICKPVTGAAEKERRTQSKEKKL
ncbi:hypothetical protein Vadar_022835 [Vaccinium darrowii]|uniref:Uncharacterized protein n=1 Tax=Vaccinium darrowii TaxID=229202 RepID=A0ACB7XJ87_9ERIC|nr:hypothetical protein Vadar_022835 [Vaccinium darrowii]